MEREKLRARSLGREDPTCPEQLSPWAGATEPVLWSPGAPTPGARVPRVHALMRAAPAVRSSAPRREWSPHLPQLEDPVQPNISK